jgi:hypothetical protein
MNSSNKNKKIETYFASPVDRTNCKRKKGESPEQLPPNSKNKVEQIEITGEMEVGKMTIDQLSDMLDGKLAGLATKEEIKQLERKMEDLATENIKLKEEIEWLKLRDHQWEERIDFVENRTKANNLIFRGLHSKEGEDLKKLIQECCATLTKEEVKINNAFYVGPRTIAPRLILVECGNPSDVSVVLQNSKKLKGTGVIIHRDLSEASRKKRSKLYAIKKKILTIDEKSSVTVKRNLLFYKNTRYSWCLKKGLLVGDKDGISILSADLKEDITLFINNLKNNKDMADAGRGRKGKES